MVGSAETESGPIADGSSGGISGLTRRRVLRDLGTAGLALSGLDALLAAAVEAAPKHGTLGDIEHVIILIQENRSFDHYFGTYSGVRGFGDTRGRGAFFQKDLAGKTVHPFRLTDECMSDITHDWGPQHRAWSHGRMDRFVVEHQKTDGAVGGLDTMGYYDGAEVGFYHALANAFTLCDRYHCSVIGPTDPNRLMSISASIDPAGLHGGPVVATSLSHRTSRVSWPTMPESLERKRISWKVYTDPSGGQFDSVFGYFTQYNTPGRLNARGIQPTYPADFMHDLASGRLPQVSWLTPTFGVSEHPEFSTPVQGQMVVRQVLEALLAHPKVWRRTALFLTWDENGGFFDHVAPPVAPPGTKGEYLTVATLPTASDNDAQGIRGPIGLGFRVPTIVVSPFSRGGLVCSDVFDHTSTLRFLERRFGAKVPNLTAWRRKHTGDLTSAFNFSASPSYGRPRLPKPVGSSACKAVPLPLTPGPFPRQQKGRRRKPSGIPR